MTKLTKEARRLYQKQWRENNPGREKSYPGYGRSVGKRAPSKKKVVNLPVHTLLHSAKRRAAQKKLPFTLTKDWVDIRLVVGLCQLTGIPFDSSRKAYLPSIDRVRPAEGYTPENCRMILWGLNAAIGSWGFAEARELWQKVLCNNRTAGRFDINTD